MAGDVVCPWMDKVGSGSVSGPWDQTYPQKTYIMFFLKYDIYNSCKINCFLHPAIQVFQPVCCKSIRVFYRYMHRFRQTLNLYYNYFNRRDIYNIHSVTET